VSIFFFSFFLTFFSPSPTYAGPGTPFPVGTLTASALPRAGVSWSNADPHAGSLLGTVRSLDTIEGPVPLNCSAAAGITVHGEGLHCAWGLTARGGVAAFDDTEGAALDPTTGYPQKREPTGQDLVREGGGEVFFLF
jgi:hypothetical protein